MRYLEIYYRRPFTCYFLVRGWRLRTRMHEFWHKVRIWTSLAQSMLYEHFTSWYIAFWTCPLDLLWYKNFFPKVYTLFMIPLSTVSTVSHPTSLIPCHPNTLILWKCLIGLIERAKRALVHGTYVKCALFRVWSNAHVQSTQKIKGTEANGKQAQRVRGIKFELAILHQSTTLPKLWNGTLDVA